MLRFDVYFLLGYDSGSHSPPSTATTPPHMLEDNDMSVSNTGETTPPVIQVRKCNIDECEYALCAFVQ